MNALTGAYAVILTVAVLFGVIARTLLVRRRRAAQQTAKAPLTERAARAAGGRTRIQRADLVLSVVLLLDALLYGASTVAAVALAENGILLNNTTPLGQTLLALDGLAFLGALLAFAAIPVACGLITRQLRDHDVLAGEAWALTQHGPRRRRIRAARLLSWSAALLYTGIGIVTVVVVVL